ncbi:PilZ domain-containing protein [uncultured Erythrobacter sp.]|uniref:PilZ domain-containing protein n=1 Tax=uncultured Erythrobacter sp. TaxID=263913 RepID=UPI00260FC81B|nr:PilZ domain-containing protein [uncultured Erythrobacter sp.]
MSAVSPLRRQFSDPEGLAAAGIASSDHAKTVRTPLLHTTECGIPIGRRGAPRLRLSVPAKFVSLYGTHTCILVDLSCTGAQVGLEEPLDVSETGFLQIAGEELFCEVVRRAQGPKGGVNGLLFDPPVAHQDVLTIRHFAETYQAEEFSWLRSQAKQWVTGSR